MNLVDLYRPTGPAQQQSEHRPVERSASLVLCRLSADRHRATFTATLVRHPVSASQETSNLKPEPHPACLTVPQDVSGFTTTHTHGQKAVVVDIRFLLPLSGISSLQSCDVFFYVCFMYSRGGQLNKQIEISIYLPFFLRLPFISLSSFRCPSSHVVRAVSASCNLANSVI